MSKNCKILCLTAIIGVLTLIICAVAANAATPASGYLLNSENKETNIKYDFTADGTLTLTIDPEAKDKVQTTTVDNKDPITGHYASWSSPHSTYEGLKTLIIGDGITSISGFSAIYSLRYIEAPTSLTHIGNAAFECCYGIQAFYIRGTEMKTGTFDFSYITKFESYCFDGNPTIKEIIFNPNLTGELPVEFIKGAGVKTLSIPAGVTKLVDQSLDGLSRLETLTVLGKSTEFQSMGVFSETNCYPSIKAYADSKAAAFAKANGFTFIDLESGAVTAGTLPAPEPESEEDVGEASGPVTDFNPPDATAFGKVTGIYYDTWWAYYRDTKTLEFVSATTAWNETGNYNNCEDGVGWQPFIDEIEHIIIGDNIGKISGGAFYDYPNLIDCRLGRQCGQLDGSFINCPKFTTIWRDGAERVEGRADLSKVSTIQDCFSGNAIKEIVLNPDIQSYGFTLPGNIIAIYSSKITDELKNYCKASFIDLVNLNDPSEIYKYWVEIDESLPKCGMKATFSFDEATGTLTIGGAGIVDDIVNYYGGGSKTSPWFSIKQKIKHVIIEDGITVLGKYAFCQAASLETVEIPDNDDFKILNGAFEKCTALKSIYRRGTDAIEGTLDLGNMEEIPSWTFGEAYLIANVVFGENIKKINKSSFDSNPNLANIYGVPGSVAEKFASDNGIAFFDISSNKPQPVTCVAPLTSDTSQIHSERVSDEENDVDTVGVLETDTETESEKLIIDFVEGGSSSSYVIYVIIGAVAAVIIATVFVVIKKRKK